jgi:hypothetical protein
MPLGFGALSEVPIAAQRQGGGPVTVTLTGLRATSRTGSLAVTLASAPAGIHATSRTGALTEAATITLAGIRGTSHAGALTPATQQALAGLRASSRTGTLVPAISIGLMGLQAAAHAGTVYPAGDVSAGLTGVHGTSRAGNVSIAYVGAVAGMRGAGRVGVPVAGSTLSLPRVNSVTRAGSVGVVHRRLHMPGRLLPPAHWVSVENVQLPVPAQQHRLPIWT